MKMLLWFHRPWMSHLILIGVVSSLCPSTCRTLDLTAVPYTLVKTFCFDFSPLFYLTHIKMFSSLPLYIKSLSSTCTSLDAFFLRHIAAVRRLSFILVLILLPRHPRWFGAITFRNSDLKVNLRTSTGPQFMKRMQNGTLHPSSLYYGTTASDFYLGWSACTLQGAILQTFGFVVIDFKKNAVWKKNTFFAARLEPVLS